MSFVTPWPFTDGAADCLVVAFVATTPRHELRIVAGIPVEAEIVAPIRIGRYVVENGLRERKFCDLLKQRKRRRAAP